MISIVLLGRARVNVWYTSQQQYAFVSFNKAAKSMSMSMVPLDRVRYSSLWAFVLRGLSDIPPAFARGKRHIDKKPSARSPRGKNICSRLY